MGRGKKKSLLWSITIQLLITFPSPPSIAGAALKLSAPVFLFPSALLRRPQHHSAQTALHSYMDPLDQLAKNHNRSPLRIGWKFFQQGSSQMKLQIILAFQRVKCILRWRHFYIKLFSCNFSLKEEKISVTTFNNPPNH